MHRANRMWWAYCASTYPRWFNGPIRVAEFGSCYVNGSVRDFFPEPAEYVGVDWRKGKNVDVVSLAHKVKLKPGFDTIISASMLEHDPYWSESLGRMVQHLGPKGGLFLSWGAALNPPHNISTAPDNLFHSLPAGRVINRVIELGLYLQEFRYEYRLPFLDDEARRKLCMGCVGLVALRDPWDSLPPIVDELLPEDDV